MADIAVLKILRIVILFFAVLGTLPGRAAEIEMRKDRYGDPLPPQAIARLGTMQLRDVHGCVAFSSDGKFLVSATGNKAETITFWDAATGRAVRRINGSTSLSKLAFSPDGKYLACSTNRCRVIEAASGKEVYAVEGVSGDFSGDGKVLVTSDSYGVEPHVYVWDAATGRQLHRSIEEGKGGRVMGVRKLTVAVRGRTLAVLSADALAVEIRDLAAGKKIRSIRNTESLRGVNMPDWWRQLALSPDGKTLATANARRVQLWDIASGEEVGGWNTSLQSRPVFSPDGKRLAWVGSSDKDYHSVRLWIAERDGANEPRPLGESVNYFGPPCFSPDGKLLAVEMTDADVLSLRDSTTGKDVLPRIAHDRQVRELALSSDGRRVVSVGRDGAEAFVWEARSGRLLRRVSLVPPGHERAVPLLPHDYPPLLWHGYFLTRERANNPQEGRCHLRDLRTGETVLSFDAPASASAAASRGRFVAVRGRTGDIRVLDVQARRFVYRVDPGGDTLGLQLSADGETLVWHRRSGKTFEIHGHRHAANKTIILPDLPGNEHVAMGLNLPCLSPEGRWLLLATEAGRIRRWDLTTGKESSPLTETLNTVWGMVWSPDSRYVAVQVSTAESHILNREPALEWRVWDTATGRRLRHLSFPHSVAIVCFSPDGRTLATDSQGVLLLWEVATGRERGRLRGHLPRPIGAAVFSADGRMLVSGGYDSQGFVWDLTGRMSDGQWRPTQLSAEQRNAAWKALASTDAKAAYRAMWQLSADLEGTLALLREEVRPIARPEPKLVMRLITALDSEVFAERERATAELEKLGETVVGDLRRSLSQKPSLEVRRRMEALLAKLAKLDDAGVPGGRQLQALQAVEVLEHMDTPEARNLLRKLTEGAPEARLTQEARQTLKRSEANKTP